MMACASASSMTLARSDGDRSGGTITSRLATPSRLHSAAAALRARFVTSTRLRPTTASSVASIQERSARARSGIASAPSSNTGGEPDALDSARNINSRKRGPVSGGLGERIGVEIHELAESLRRLLHLDVAQGIHAESIFEPHHQDRETEGIKPAIQQREVIV